jgi:hypothetical protein
MRLTVVLVVVTALFPACDWPYLSEGDGPHCEDTVLGLSMDEEAPLGFAPAVVVELAISPSPWAETLTWADGEPTELTLDLSNPQGARFLDSSAVYPDGSEASAIGLVCEDRVALDATLSFETADGELDEVWTVTLESRDGDEATFFEQVDPFALRGSYDVAAHIEEPDWDEVTMFVSGVFDAEGTTGDVRGQVTGEDECTGDGPCAAWAMDLPVGTWGTARD